MRVLVLGATGLLGSSLVPHLRMQGHEVFTHGRSPGPDVTFEATDASALQRALNALRPESIINLVALTNVDECERSPQGAYVTNVRPVELLADYVKCSSTPVHLVQISTDQVYDGPGPHREHDVTLTNYYAFSKFAGELAARSVLSTVLRTNFFGPSRRAGRTSLSDWLVNSAVTRTPITVFDDVHFSPLTLSTLAAQIELVVRQPQSGIFNLGSTSGMSKAEFAFQLARALGLSTDAMTRGSSAAQRLVAYRPKNMCMNSSRFEQAFGVRLPTLEQEIESVKVAYGIQTKQ